MPAAELCAADLPADRAAAEARSLRGAPLFEPFRGDFEGFRSISGPFFMPKTLIFGYFCSFLMFFGPPRELFPREAAG